MIILETERLKLREFLPEDAQAIFDLNNDPEVIKYSGDVAFTSLEEAKQFLISYNNYKEHGYGRWSVILKETGKFIGWCGLKYLTNEDETDIGYRFFRKDWNKGYATEAAKACIDYGFNELKLNKIVGHAMSENEQSVKVLSKIGLSYCKSFDFKGKKGVYYKIENPNLVNITIRNADNAAS